MTKQRLYLILSGAFCALLAALFSFAVISVYREGLATREAGDVTAWIFTREKLMARFLPLLPFLFGYISFLIAGWVMGVRGETKAVSARSLSRMEAFAGQKDQKARQERREAWLRRGLLAAAIVMIAAGILNGSLRDVLVKAVNLCAECVGLG